MSTYRFTFDLDTATRLGGFSRAVEVAGPAFGAQFEPLPEDPYFGTLTVEAEGQEEAHGRALALCEWIAERDPTLDDVGGKVA